MQCFCYLVYKTSIESCPLAYRTRAGMTSAAESITESLRRTRQLMVQVGLFVFVLVYMHDFVFLASSVYYISFNGQLIFLY